MKKGIKAIIFISIIIMICLIAALWLYVNNVHGNRINTINELYEKVEKFLISSQDEVYITDDKENVRNATGKDFKTFIDMAKLGMNKRNDEIYVYVWALIENYYVDNNGAVQKAYGSSMPYKFTFKDNEIVNCQIPMDGADYSASLNSLFPQYIINILNNSLVSDELIKYEVKEYYSYLDKIATPTVYWTFYAEIEKINENSILVKGLEVNDLNHLGEYEISISEETSIYWNYQPIKMDNLGVGDTIAITYNGIVKETYPAQIDEISQIVLLNHEVKK